MNFITKANAMKIVTSSINDVKGLNGTIYEPMKIYFFSKYEKNQLLAIKELLKDPEKYFTEIYVPIETEDTYTLVYEGNNPCYHESDECEFLYSNMRNYKIPEDIVEMGKEKVLEFREWFKSVQYLLIDESKLDVFVARLHARWGINTNVNALNYDNSGISSYDNIEIPELKKRINAQIKAAGRFYYESELNKKILSKFSRISFLAYKDDPIYGNETGLSDEELKSFLKHYNKKYKKPIKSDLVEYYKLEYNPKIEMRGKILNQLGFKSCSQCH